MKQSLLIIASISCLLLTSCKQESSDPLSFKNKDHSLEIVVSGERMFFLDPWTMNIQLSLADTNFVHTSTEVQVDEFSTSTISVDWESINKARVIVKEKDGSIRQIPVTVIR